MKLHGTNAAIGVDNDGHLFAQKRSSITTVKDCSTGFAAFVQDLDEQLDHVRGDLKSMAGRIIYGEWFGPGIQKGTSASLVDDKYFAGYAIHRPDTKTNFLITNEKDTLYKYIKNISHKILWLPVHETIHINFLDHDSVTNARTIMNKLISDIQFSDPFIEEIFGISGPGEGYVAYSFDHMREVDGSLHPHKFKIKTEKFAETKSSVGSSVDYEKYAEINALAFDLATVARLEQGLTEVDHDNFDIKKIGDYLRWVSTDIEKECQNEIAESGFTNKEIFRAISKVAGDYYKQKIKEL